MSLDSRLFRPEALEQHLGQLGLGQRRRLDRRQHDAVAAARIVGGRGVMVFGRLRRAAARPGAGSGAASTWATAASMRSSVSVLSSSRSSRRTPGCARRRHVGRQRGRLVDVEQPRRTHQPAGRRGRDRLHQRIVRDGLAGDHRKVTPDRLLARQRLKRRQVARAAAARRRVRTASARRQLVGLAPLRMQFADEADRSRRRARCARSAPGARPGARRRRSARLRGASNASRSPLRSKKSTARSRAPLQRLDGAEGQPGRCACGCSTPATLASRRRRGSRRKTRPISNTRTRVALREVEAQHADQAAEQARAHHRERAGDRVQYPDRIGVAGELVLPARLDEAEADRLLVVESGERVAQSVRLRRARCAPAPSPVPAGACRKVP